MRSSIASCCWQTVCGSRTCADRIASKLGVPGFVVRNITTCARAYTISELEQAVKDFVDAEESVKTGRLEDKLSVELLIIKYSSKVK